MKIGPLFYRSNLRICGLQLSRLLGQLRQLLVEISQSAIELIFVLRVLTGL